MKPFTFTGAMVPSFTPFNQDESLKLEVIPAYAKHLKANGITAVWVSGTAGEGMSLTISERKACAEAWMKCRNEISTVIVHCGAGCLKDTCELAKHAEELGVEGVATLPNLFDKPKTTDDLVDYMAEVAKACPNTPLFYYHIPMKTGVNLSMSDFLAKGVKRIPNLSGLKFTDNDVSGEGKKCIQVAKGSLTIFNGFDERLQEAASVGFRSAVGGTFSAFPSFPNKIFSLMKDSKTAEAEQLQKVHLKHIEAMFKQTPEFTVASLKTAASVLSGIDMGPTRLPVKPFTPSMVQGMRNDFKNMGLTVY